MTATSPPLDINPTHLETIQRILDKHVPDCEVRAFGSRAKWHAEDYSDLDLAVVGEQPLGWRVLGKLETAFEESDLPFRVDILDWHDISDEFRTMIEDDCIGLQRTVRQNYTTQSKDPQATTPTRIYHPYFPRGWYRHSLYSLAEWVNGLAFKKFQFSKSGKPIIKIAEIKNGITSQTKFTEQKFDESVLIKTGDLLFSWSGQPETSIDAFRWYGPDGWLNQHIFRVFPNDTVDKEFFYYLLRYLKPTFVQIAGNKQTTGLGHVTKRDLQNLQVAVPSLTEQQRIAHILKTLDDRIKLNRHMNETLKAMAQALFKSWFIDFEPVRAKVEGRWRPGESLPGFPAHLYDLFPDRLDHSELGNIPEGWKVGVLTDLITLHSGGTPNTDTELYWNGEIPWYTAKDTPILGDIFTIKTKRTVTLAGVHNSPTKVLPTGTTIVTARGTVGKLGLLGVPMAMNQTCYGIRGNQGYSDFFIYWLTRTTVDEMQKRTHGTIFDTITRQTFKLITVTIPPHRVVSMFDNHIDSIMELILNNICGIRNLTILQEYILPRFMANDLSQIRIGSTL